MSAANQEGHSLGEWGNSFDIPLWRRRIRNSVLVSVNCHLDTVRSHLGEIGVSTESLSLLFWTVDVFCDGLS